jgi:hypothetical protein
MSVSLTISNLDDETFRRLQMEAQRRGQDVESLSRSLISRGLPVAAANSGEISPGPPYHDLDFMIGTWTDQEANEFTNIVSDFRRIDPEMWRQVNATKASRFRTIAAQLLPARRFFYSSQKSFLKRSASDCNSFGT